MEKYKAKTPRHYRKQHKRHKAVLAVSYFFTIALILTFWIVYLQTQSAIGSSSQIQLSLQVGEPGTTEADVPAPQGGLGSSGSVSPIVDTPKSKVKSTPVVFLIELLNQDGTVPAYGQVQNDRFQTHTPSITSKRVTFRGKVGFANALLLLELHSDIIMTSTVRADEDGNWEWRAPQDLEAGDHTLYVTGFDAAGEVILFEATLPFYLAADDGAADESSALPVPLASPPEPSLYSQGELVYDALVEVPGAYSVLHPGEDLIIKLDLFNGRLSAQTFFDVQYQIVDIADNKAVFKVDERVESRSRHESYVRVFRTGLGLPPGEYRVEVLIPYPDGGIKVFTSDTFRVDGQPVLTFAGGAKTSVNLVLQALGVMLTVFVLIMYYELKQVERLGRMIHQVTETDLLKGGFISHH